MAGYGKNGRLPKGMSNLDDMEMRKDELEQEYEWFLREVLDDDDRIARIIKKDSIGSTDEEFQDYKNL
jgi:hypothetical protein